MVIPVINDICHRKLQKNQALFLLSEHLKNGFLHCLYGVDGDILLHPYCFINQRGTVWWSGAGPLTEYHLYSARDTSDISDTHFSHRFDFTLSPSNTFHEYHLCSSWDSYDILHTRIFHIWFNLVLGWKIEEGLVKNNVIWYQIWNCSFPNFCHLP